MKQNKLEFKQNQLLGQNELGQNRLLIRYLLLGQNEFNQNQLHVRNQLLVRKQLLVRYQLRLNQNQLRRCLTALFVTFVALTAFVKINFLFFPTYMHVVL
uniref:Uncharacterized protein n=1 Tax=Chrysodeixis includens nucleopolyhedrovirus TaxID=1207438 RepID=A0A1C8ZXA9_9ABAC|nr:hypothetical protein [Chrysodeixis includens nucleopolyhedrovirus]AOL56869.1 hypothetical protein [Chrysodeixis includens nucleopolyhedrovirus]